MIAEFREAICAFDPAILKNGSRQNLVQKHYNGLRTDSILMNHIWPWPYCSFREILLLLHMILNLLIPFL